MLQFYDTIKKLKQETNNIEDIIYRFKKINNKNICIIFNEPLTSTDKISEFIVKCINRMKTINSKNLIEKIEKNIDNSKIKQINNYKELCSLIHKGFTIILIENEKNALALETRLDISRSIQTPDTENSLRGSKDAFVEDYQKNIGLIKKRIRSNNLWIENTTLGKYTDTKIGIVYVHGIVKQELIDEIKRVIKQINIDGIIGSETLKNLIDSENKSVLPTIISTERPDIVSESLLMGKIAIVVDNSPYVLVIPAVLNDFFKTTEDNYGKSKNVTFTRIIKTLAFFISVMTPAIYIALITFNQEMIPTILLSSFSAQRQGVPFPAIIEAIIMLISFEILRESDLRVPGFTGSSLSIVGALILGDAAVSAGIVSPIMIIVIALTSISALPFSEPELTNGIRWYRFLFMVGASILGIVGVVIVFIYFIIELASLNSYGVPYLIPYAPTYIEGLKNSIIKFPLKKINKRSKYLSNNLIKQRNDFDEN